GPVRGAFELRVRRDGESSGDPGGTQTPGSSGGSARGKRCTTTRNRRRNRDRAHIVAPAEHGRDSDSPANRTDPNVGCRETSPCPARVFAFRECHGQWPNESLRRVCEFAARRRSETTPGPVPWGASYVR